MKAIKKMFRSTLSSIDHRLNIRMINIKSSHDGFDGLIDNPTEIIYVPVDYIKHECTSSEVKTVRRHRSYLFRQPIYRDGNILDGNWDQERKNYSMNHHYIEFSERFLEEKTWEETSIYDRFKKKLENGLYTRGNVKSWQEFKSKHLKRWDELFIDIKNNGYRSNYELTGKAYKEVVVCVSRSGEIMRPPFGGGNHRFAITKILGIKEIPVVVSVWHKQYIDRLKEHTKIKKLHPK